jgi:branched-chain amino acid transport system ATP-binding protein
MTDTTPILTAENLRVRYRNGALGIVDVSFEVQPGRVIGLFGPNGAGKTTSMRAVSGFLRTEGARVIAGRVTLAGHDVTNHEPHRQAASGVAFVPERNKVFPSLTVAENLAAVSGLPKGARRAELNDMIYTLFPLLAERRREYAGRLSGGQRQMLALARGIIRDPRVLIVDEMTLGLHHSVQPPLFEAVRRVAESGTAVILVDESTGFALEACDHCYILSAGRVHEHGPAEKFRGSELIAAGYVEAG